MITIQKTKTILPKARPQPPLGFGKYFTDHMFLADFNRSSNWHNYRIVPYHPISLDPAACVFHYSQALFEGLKAFKNEDGKVAIFRPQFNAARMKMGAERLCMPPVPADLFIQSISELVKIDSSWIPDIPHCALYIRPTLIGTEGFLGVRPSDQYLFFVILSPVGSYYSQESKPVKIWVEQAQIRAATGGLGEVKAAANYAASLQAATIAKAKGYDQVLWLDAKNRDDIEEVGTMNIFFVLKGEVVTPSLRGSILGGSIRECVITILKSWGMKCSERTIGIKELADLYKKGEVLEIFGTGTAAMITSVNSLTWGNEQLIFGQSQNSLATKLYQAIDQIQRGQVQDSFNWLHWI